jgi:hypothetical protein
MPGLVTTRYLVLLKDGVALEKQCKGVRGATEITVNNGQLTVGENTSLDIKCILPLATTKANDHKWMGTRKDRSAVAQDLAAQCRISGSSSRKDSALGNVLSVELAVLIVRALEVMRCTAAAPGDIVRALLLGRENMPTFRAGVVEGNPKYIANIFKEFEFAQAPSGPPR